MSAEHIATLPGFYPLFAVYADFVLNNTQTLGQEEAQRVQMLLRQVRQALGLNPAYEKSWALRLFTERENLRRMPPEQVRDAWALLREAIEQQMAADLPRKPHGSRYGQGWGRPKPRRVAKRGSDALQEQALAWVPTSPVDYRRRA